MTTYNEELKLSVIQRMINNESVMLISKETGIPKQTLYAWKKVLKIMECLLMIK